MRSCQDVLDAARGLTATDRMRLVDALWDADWPVPSDDWIVEAGRRSAAFDLGEMSAAKWPDVRDRARRQAGLNE